VYALSFLLLIRGILAALRQKIHLTTCPNSPGHLWWLGTNHSRQTIGRIIEMARNAARAECGKDLVANLG